MSLPDMRVSQVTDHPNTETYPRISPDGRSIVFARAHRTWVSQRNERDWDVYWRDLASGEERLVATNATAPTWADADTVVFEEEVSRVMAHRLSTGERRVLCEGGRGNVPAGVAMQTPEYNPKDRLVAVTFRGAARMTALVDERNHFRKVGGGCQLFWSPDHVFLYYADHGGRMKNAFYQVDPATMRRDLWFDAEGEWSHEYFPKLSSDGRWLAYGASAKGHEHDTADYEIFLWKAGEPFGSSVRLTWHTGNDCWPDIFVNTVQ
jgi:Tol biopolymer transport system component